MSLILIHYQRKKVLQDIQSCIAISAKVFDSIIHYLESLTNRYI